MKRYINLFTQQATQKKSVVVIRKLKNIGTIIVGVLFVILAIVWALYYYFNAQIAKQTTKQSNYERVILQNKSLDKKIAIFLFKYQQLKQFIKEDAEVAIYYELLLGQLNNLGGQASIESFTVANDQTTEFSLMFPSYEQAITFLGIMEKETFTSYFESLSLENFTIETDKNDTYTLEFKGKFKKITDGTES